jgi:hypothetical protein
MNFSFDMSASPIDYEMSSAADSSPTMKLLLTSDPSQGFAS